MINVESLMQVKAFARQDGVLLALLWIASFACVVLMPQSMLGTLLAIATPFFVGWRLGKFRNYALNGIISFRRSYAFSVYTFVYATLIFAIAQYVYFRFLDGGVFTNMVETTVQTMIPIYEQNGISAQQLTDSLALITKLTPVEWAFTFLMQNLIIGLAISLPIAAIGMRRRLPNGGITPNQQ